jgi:hypothetical protein
MVHKKSGPDYGWAVEVSFGTNKEMISEKNFLMLLSSNTPVIFPYVISK